MKPARTFIYKEIHKKEVGVLYVEKHKGPCGFLIIFRLWKVRQAML